MSKVYCSQCKWLSISITGAVSNEIAKSRAQCTSPNNSVTVEDWYKAEKEQISPASKNSSNDCEWYEATSSSMTAK